MLFRSPKQEYKRESFELFEELLKNIQVEVIKFLSLVRIRKEQDVDAIDKQRQAEESKVISKSIHQDPEAEAALAEASAAAPALPPRTPMTRTAPKVGRNEPCPCGSGQKYKSCHGRVDT